MSNYLTDSEANVQTRSAAAARLLGLAARRPWLTGADHRPQVDGAGAAHLGKGSSVIPAHFMIAFEKFASGLSVWRPPV